eukprot:5165496-Amphidinium_carterae.1
MRPCFGGNKILHNLFSGILSFAQQLADLAVVKGFLVHVSSDHHTLTDCLSHNDFLCMEFRDRTVRQLRDEGGHPHNSDFRIVPMLLKF